MHSAHHTVWELVMEKEHTARTGYGGRLVSGVGRCVGREGALHPLSMHVPFHQAAESWPGVQWLQWQRRWPPCLGCWSWYLRAAWPQRAWLFWTSARYAWQWTRWYLRYAPTAAVGLYIKWFSGLSCVVMDFHVWLGGHSFLPSGQGFCPLCACPYLSTRRLHTRHIYRNRDYLVQ